MQWVQHSQLVCDEHYNEVAAQNLLFIYIYFFSLVKKPDDVLRVDVETKLSLGGMKDGGAWLRSDEERHKGNLSMLRICSWHF